MLRSLKEIEGYRLHAIDGDLGKTKDFLFDDQRWAVRYAVVDTGKWLPGKRVAVSPASFSEPDWGNSLIPTTLTQEQVRDAPPVEENRPVSRQQELALAQQFDWPTYWLAPTAGTVWAAAIAQPPSSALEETEPVSTQEDDPHLRSLKEVAGYKVRASDGDVGSVSDFIVDTDTWTLRYLVADTHKWLPGGKVLLSPEWIDAVQWIDRAVEVDLEAARIKACPPYQPSEAVNREYEQRIYDYYGRPHYWI